MSVRLLPARPAAPAAVVPVSPPAPAPASIELPWWDLANAITAAVLPALRTLRTAAASSGYPAAFADTPPAACLPDQDLRAWAIATGDPAAAVSAVGQSAWITQLDIMIAGFVAHQKIMDGTCGDYVTAWSRYTAGMAAFSRHHSRLWM